MPKRILHIAPMNISGVPITFVKAERALGFESRLITLVRDRREYEEDVCLELPFLDFSGTRFLKRFVSDKAKLAVNNTLAVPERIPKVWKAHSVAEAALISFRELVWKRTVARAMQDIDFWNHDVYQLDGGLEFFRDGRTVRQLKAMGKTIICCYTGSDLRTRGVIPDIDRLSDANVTLEFDHLRLHPQIQHVCFPFDVGTYQVAPFEERPDKIRIGHAPTNRHAKGSHRIMAVLDELKSELAVEIVLIENMSHAECLKRKSQCHIFIDQIGDLGYGLNSLESLAMGIPTCSCLAEGFAAQYPDHPFIEITYDNIKTRLRKLITTSELRRTYHAKSRRWVERYHDHRKVVQTIHRIASVNSGPAGTCATGAASHASVKNVRS